MWSVRGSVSICTDVYRNSSEIFTRVSARDRRLRVWYVSRFTRGLTCRDIACPVGVLSEIDDFESPEDIVEALGAILLESHEEATQEIVDELCEDLFTTLKGYVL